MKENKLVDLSMDFSIKIIKLCETIKGHSSLVNQLERSATSIGSLLLLGIVLFFPSNFRVDPKGITICFVFIFRISATWNELHTIEDHYCKAFPWLREYHVGYFKTCFPFWEKVCIPKNKNTTTMIEKYYKKCLAKNAQHGN